MIGAARILRALIAKDLAILTGRPGLWLVRTGFVAILFVGVAIAWLTEDPAAQDATGLAALSRTIATALTIGAVGLCGLASSAITVGAIDEERQRGSLEILIASPLSGLQVLLSVVASRGLIAGQFLLAALPIFAMPLIFGGVAPAEIILRTIIPSLLAFLLAALWTVSAACEGPLRWQILLTPAGVSLLGSLWLTRSALELWELAVVDVLAAAALVWSVIGLSGPAKRLRSGFERVRDRPAPERYRYGAAERRSRVSALRRLAKGVDGAIDHLRVPLPMRAREVMRRVRGIERWVYQASGRNPFVLRELLRSPGDLDYYVAAAGCFLRFVAIPVVGGAVVVGVNLRAELPGPYPVSGGALISQALIGLVTLACAPLAAIVVTRIIPSRSEAGLLDAIQSTPLRGLDIAFGAVEVAGLRLSLLFGIVGVAGFAAGILSFKFLLPILYPLLVLAALLFGAGVGLWASLLVRKRGEAAALACAALALSACGWVLLSPSLPPLVRFGSLFRFMKEMEAAVLAPALVFGLIGWLLIGSFAVAFDRAMGRPAAVGGRRP